MDSPASGRNAAQDGWPATALIHRNLFYVQTGVKNDKMMVPYSFDSLPPLVVIRLTECSRVMWRVADRLLVGWLATAITEWGAQVLWAPGAARWRL
jgi:hypothetical protein